MGVDTLSLVLVTLLSLAMAAALSVVVWRMLRDDRQRKDARVQALAELARAEPAPTSRRPPDRPEAKPSFDLPLRPAPQPSAPPSRPLRPAAAPTIETHATSGTLFAEPSRDTTWGTRAAIVAALALGAAALVLFVMAARVRTSTALEAHEAAQAASAPLELVSLGDSREGSSLVIRGIVQNPRGGARLNRVVVAAFTFDDNGSPLASARALIDVTALAPGDESPFVVRVPVADTVARYRIGFRTEDGRVITHVDRRPRNTMAANW